MDSAMISAKRTNPIMMASLFGLQAQAGGDTGDSADFPLQLADIFGPILGVLLPTLILVIVAIVVYTRMRRNNRKQETPQPAARAPRPRQGDTPEARALEALEVALYNRAEPAIREYYASIACLILQYLGEKYQIQVHEATTTQILSDVAEVLPEHQIDYVGEILHTCDMVQFTPHHPTRSEQDDIYETARDFLEGQAKGS